MFVSCYVLVLCDVFVSFVSFVVFWVFCHLEHFWCTLRECSCCPFLEFGFGFPFIARCPCVWCAMCCCMGCADFSGMRKVKSADAFIVWLCEAFSCVKLC
jgi:hypothetical protein